MFPEVKISPIIKRFSIFRGKVDLQTIALQEEEPNEK
jgi:hypothetical protein